jgi:glycerophosphoryl diester phosphodiesterase
MKQNVRSILVVAHRGACGYAPENTFPSFDLAVEQGDDILEFDVHLTKGRVPIVIYDDTLERTTGITGRVECKSLLEINQLNAAAKRKHHFESVPTLEEVVDRYCYKAQLMVEIKHGSSFYQGIEHRENTE